MGFLSRRTYFLHFDDYSFCWTWYYPNNPGIEHNLVENLRLTFAKGPTLVIECFIVKYSNRCCSRAALVDLITLSLVIVPLIVIVDPPASIALFLAMGSDLGKRDLQVIATRACAFASLVLLTFLFVGEGLLNHIGVEMYSLRIAGGLMLGIVGMNMLKEGQKPSGKVIPVASGGEIAVDDSSDFSLVPLGMPMIAGPGSITLVILMGTIYGFSTVSVAILVVMSITLSLFYFASNMKNVLGENSTKAITRVMGLLIVTTAVQFFLDGLDMWQLTL